MAIFDPEDALSTFRLGGSSFRSYVSFVRWCSPSSSTSPSSGASTGLLQLQGEVTIYQVKLDKRISTPSSYLNCRIFHVHKMFLFPSSEKKSFPGHKGGKHMDMCLPSGYNLWFCPGSPPQTRILEEAQEKVDS